jgi:hypothetical protein
MLTSSGWMGEIFLKSLCCIHFIAHDAAIRA